jgi:hypothetical protein
MRLKRFSKLAAIVGLVMTPSLLAEAKCAGDKDISNSVKACQPGAGGTSPKMKGALLSPACGDTITSSVTLAADLNCPSTTGFALNVVGANITVNGNGHSISAPNAAAGLFVKGSNISISNLKVNGVQGGDGILAYETPGLSLDRNDVSGNLQGIVVYADQTALSGVSITNNIARQNQLFGIRTGYDAPGAIVMPAIKSNDLSGSGSFAMRIRAVQFELGQGHGNIFDGSANGIYLSGGDMYVHDFNFDSDLIYGVGVFGDSLNSIIVNNFHMYSRAPATPLQNRIGLDLYRAGAFSITNVRTRNCDVGIKLETELGVSPSGFITDSHFEDDTFSGIFVVSYDGTPYGLLDFFKNHYQLSSPALRVFVQGSTTYAPGSILDDGRN